MNKGKAMTKMDTDVEKVFNGWETLKVLDKGNRKNRVLKNIIKRNFKVEFKTALKTPLDHSPEDSIIRQVPSHPLLSNFSFLYEKKLTPYLKIKRSLSYLINDRLQLSQ